jgi:DNA-binding MarR family transcriptional regulator
VTLNIDVEQKTDPTGPAADRPLVDEALDELTSWNPREFVAAFQRWHHGSVSLVHLTVLSLLEFHGPMSMSKLAEALDISVASMTGVIDRMEKRGLVERRHDVEDRRVVLVAPAAGGLAMFTDVDTRRRTGMRTLLGRLSNAELDGLILGHRALRAARGAASESGGSGS